jgi:GTPase SAR1 family protein
MGEGHLRARLWGFQIIIRAIAKQLIIKMNREHKAVNSHIQEYLDYYCNLSHAPGFAVLLKGQWGCGKTWFIEKYCEELKEKLKANGQKCLYVSLYGVTSFSEIEDAFFQQLHPVLSSKGMAITGKILKGLLKGALKIDLNNDGKDDGTLTPGIPNINLPEYLKNTDKSILIFDDLERCQINISNLLGYINYFVEHDDLKVIIIANEDELLKSDTGDSYKIIKEKLIGKTFGVLLDFKGALESFITIGNNSYASQFLSDNIELIENLYKKANFENLRCLRQVLLDFDRIYEVLPEKAKSNQEIIQDILKVLMAFSIEIKRGNMYATDINKLQDEYVSMIRKQIPSHQEYNESTKQNNQEETKLKKILGTYPELSLHEPVLGQEFWETFFDKGILDKHKLETSLSTSKYFQDENTPNWVKLWHFAYLSDDEFDNLLKEVESEYIDRKFIELGIIKHITGLFLKFSDAGLYHKNREVILKESKMYINSLKDNKTLDIPENRYNYADDGILGGAYAGLGYQGKEFVEFKEFCSYIEEVKELAKDEGMLGAAHDLIDIMQNDTSRFYTMICESNYSEQIYYKIPILKHIEPSVFVEKLLEMKFNDKQYVGWALTKRYEFDNINEKLSSELDWLKSVKNLLSEEAHRKKHKISGLSLKLLIEEYFNKTIEKLEKM